ncbi:MAG TPA: hypothetical protein VGL86_06760 [Polyangia bacterium]|jgi:hypothetical protein
MASGKGTLLKNLGDYVVEHHSQAAWREVVDGLPADDRAIIDGLLLVGGWYPVGTWNRCIAAYIARYAKDADAEMTAVARYVADRDLNTLFKVLLKMGSAEFVLGRTDSLWSRYFDMGKLEPSETDKRRWALKLTAPVGVDEAPGELTCGPGVCGWLTQALQLTGVKTPRVVQARCRFHASAACEYEVTW